MIDVAFYHTIPYLFLSSAASGDSYRWLIVNLKGVSRPLLLTVFLMMSLSLAFGGKVGDKE